MIDNPQDSHEETSLCGDVPVVTSSGGKWSVESCKLRRRKIRARWATLASSVRARKDRKKLSQAEVVAWVSEYLHDLIDNVNQDEIPNGAALWLWKWARDNEDDFRKLYDAKLVRAADVSVEPVEVESTPDSGREAQKKAAAAFVGRIAK